jgi:hypothetical protein
LKEEKEEESKKNLREIDKLTRRITLNKNVQHTISTERLRAETLESSLKQSVQTIQDYQRLSKYDL